MKRILFVLAIALLLAACNEKDEGIRIHTQKNIIGLASPVKLNTDTTTIFLEDYFLNTNMIDSVHINGELLDFGKGENTVDFITQKNLPPLCEMLVWTDGIPYSIPVMKSKKIKYTFRFDPGDKTYKTVQVTSSINGWNPSATNLELKNGTWETDVWLNPGNHYYQLSLDGKWVLDPGNPDSIDNNMGGFNSLLSLGNDNKGKEPFIRTEEIEGDEIDLEYSNEPEEVFAYWNNYRLHDVDIGSEDNEIELDIPKQAEDYKRSFIRLYAYNEAGVSNDVLIPLENGKVVSTTKQLSRNDLRSMIIYNIMVDRFYNGDSTNDFPVDDPDIHPRANYYGGDLKGILQKVEEGYFDELGVNTLWISPIVLNPEGAYGLYPEPRTKFSGYHGYWPISFTEIDYRFGTNEELKQLVSELHNGNKNLLLDIVANHVHEEHPVYKAHPDWATNLYLPDGSLNTERWDEYRLTTWFDVFLPTLDLSKKEVYEMLSDSALFWIKEYGIDGFRHDATKHIPEIFWRTLTRKLKTEVMVPENRYVYQIGETYGNGELIGSYVNSGQLDAQFDFNMYDAAIAVFGKDEMPFSRLDETIKESFQYYGNHHLMGNISGNQDRARFISYAGGDLGWEEDAKYAGWTRKIGVGDPVGYEKLKMLLAFNMTIPGLPVIFYGDEYGMPGGNDPDNRKMMKFEGLSDNEKSVKETTQKLIDTRNQNMALLFGDYKTMILTDNMYVFERRYFDNICLVAFNKSEFPVNIELDVSDYKKLKDFKPVFDTEVSYLEGIISLQLEPYSFEILTK